MQCPDCLNNLISLSDNGPGKRNFILQAKLHQQVCLIENVSEPVSSLSFQRTLTCEGFQLRLYYETSQK
ncbi:hypothetical protein VTL71DRAFT_16271 [Oculimacula yallundae]|uniref:Uncharacterized protein n=1 Tax=Oculimacula yallundae TaxID=86028 RepID=A0ABR4CE52_9HELO